ncbi:recombinase family protein [Vagococcus sp. BWB3-3]|uniref:Recombinase family protein n=1 Tax=Vagococcus allomyrinae TaxID=2794353 RepID=A0A940PF32_9ENTE|nr:recombinase family protein [Vagococcus allomyrinae]MBP1042813.1 recombinase family protein [Vagococcus allomyrinae]
MATYGYVRRQHPLPTNDQLKIVVDYDCQEIFIDSANYQQTEEFERLLSHLKPGDTVIIPSLQVFAASAADISNILKRLRQKEIQLISWSTQLHLNYYKRTAGLL